MRNVHIISNPDRDVGGAVTARVVEIIQRRGLTACDSTEGADMIITLGGDGTLLRAAPNAAASGIPLLGINLGHIGFFTAFDADELDNLDAVLDGEFIRDERTLLSVSSHGDLYLALNDAVISGEPGKTIGVSFSRDKKHAVSFRGDGVIVSTPSGSTAYSMSAGGPICDSAVDCMILAPVCAHTPYARPFVLPSGAECEITCDANAALTVDGRLCGGVPKGERVLISRAYEKLTLLRLKSYDFYDIMGKKLWNI